MDIEETNSEIQTEHESLILPALTLALGIGSLIFDFIHTWTGMILAIGGILLGIYSRKQCRGHRLAVSGLIVSAAGLAEGILIMAFTLWFIGEMLVSFV